MVSKNIMEVFHRCSDGCSYGSAYPKCPFRVIEGLSYASRDTWFSQLQLKQAQAIIEMAVDAGCPSIGRLH
jgi:hypothetical protein